MSQPFARRAKLDNDIINATQFFYENGGKSLSTCAIVNNVSYESTLTWQRKGKEFFDGEAIPQTQYENDMLAFYCAIKTGKYNHIQKNLQIIQQVAQGDDKQIKKQIFRDSDGNVERTVETITEGKNITAATFLVNRSEIESQQSGQGAEFLDKVLEIMEKSFGDKSELDKE